MTERAPSHGARSDRGGRGGGRRRPAPRCPLREGDPCSLCVPGASGPQDCGLVYLVASDPELRERWEAQRRRDPSPGHVGAPGS